MENKYFKYKWMAKLDSFFMALSKIMVAIIVGGIILYMLYKYVVPYEVGKREFYEKEFYKNHQNY